ncbi:MAG: DNA-processing protein DprA [Campylobacteraceae bacterium]|jgi:DNA processing protein|nr:DNA-processing protein DprA [Campylobacteraceae bacterium]
MTAIPIPPILSALKEPVKELYAQGNLELLKRTKVAIVGSRKALLYSKNMTERLSFMLSSAGVVVVSGGAMGVDAAAHRGAMPNTIAVLPTSLDILYPKINSALLKEISESGLLISEYGKGAPVSKYNFVLRNRIVAALSNALVIAQADLNSGSLRSAEYAIECGVPIYVFPHRIGESEGSAQLVKNGQAEVIEDFGAFVKIFAPQSDINGNGTKDELLAFCAKNSDLNECLRQFGDKIYEYELAGKIEIKGMRVKIV